MCAVPENSNSSKRVEFVRESTTGTTPSDPDWLVYSDVVTTSSAEPDFQSEARRGISSPDPDGHVVGPEDASIEIEYFLQRWLTASTADASDDGASRDNDGNLPNTHSVQIREDRQTASGAGGGGIRTYTIGKGGKIDEVTFDFDPSTGLPIAVSLSYQFQKVRYYQIDQPSSSGNIDVESTDSGDTTQTVTIEDEEADTTEDVDLDGTTTQTTTSSFGDIDAVEVDAETVGDVLIKDSDGNELMRIRGTSTMPDGYEANLGVPALGSGSHESALGSSYEKFLGDSIERPSGTAIAANIQSGELSISNNVDASAKASNQRQEIREGNRDVVLSATVHGETESQDQFIANLKHNTDNIIWSSDGGSIQLDNAVNKAAIAREYSEGDELMEVDVEFEGDGVTIS